MTLIELMVVVVILTTLVAGVLPLVSPNNDARKIREGSRGLKTFLMMAQAEAARTGRPVGIGFRESSPDSGVAIEAFQLAVPPEYPGSSAGSRVGIEKVPDVAGEPQIYPRLKPGTRAQFSKSAPNNRNNDYNGRDLYGAQLYRVQSLLATDPARNVSRDMLPPGMFRVGDVFNVDGMRFLIVDDIENVEKVLPGQPKDSAMFLDPASNSDDILICIWLNAVQFGNNVLPPPNANNRLYRYQIARQPAGGQIADPFMASVQPSYQFPAGIGIDLNGSGFERDGGTAFFKNPPVPNGPTPPPASAGIMFSPNGGVENVWVNGYKIDSVDRIFLLVGRGENGSLTSPSRYSSPQQNSSNPTDWYVEGSESDDEIKDLRAKINWLNPESRWLMIEPAGNRLKVVENAVYDPRDSEFLAEIEQLRGKGGKGGNEIQSVDVKALQIEHAHELAHGLDHDHGGGQ